MLKKNFHEVSCEKKIYDIFMVNWAWFLSDVMGWIWIFSGNFEFTVAFILFSKKFPDYQRIEEMSWEFNNKYFL